MDLLTADWIPVQHQNQFKQISLETLLTEQAEQAEFTISLPRDDMELACLQLLICLTQVLFTPKDKKELFSRLKTPLTIEQYQAAIADKIDWFELDHPTQPFMQVREVKAKEFTDMAKLFAGLDSKSSCCFMNEPNLASYLCPSCAVIGIFNQASNTPSFGGGFKSSLRGGTPITTLVLSEHLNDLRHTIWDLRHTIWSNVLSEDTLMNIMTWYAKTKEQAPVWVEPIKAGAKIHASETGLLRGLFWQPTHIELVKGQRGQCSCCGIEDERYSGFNKEKFVYNFIGTFPHPHAPRSFKLNRGEREEKFASFTTTAPAWTQLCQFMIVKEDDRQGQTPAAVVTQAQQLAMGEPLFLLVGGYRNNSAAILERHHDLFNIAQGWQDHIVLIERIVNLGLAYKTELRKKLYGFYKATQIDCCATAESQFYKQSESLIHEQLTQLANPELLHKELSDICRNIFNQLTEPYQDNPAIIKALTIARRSLEKAFKTLQVPSGEA
jgi:CRISPR system Cascade subunit CasA